MALPFSHYDRRNYTTVGVREGYGRWARGYDASLSDDLDLWLLRRLRTVSWALPRAIDLACGTGRIGAWLVASGVQRVEGVDVCPEMLERAQARGVYASLACEDIRNSSLPGGADLVINVLSIEHLPELGPFYAELARLTRAGGTAVIVGYHPYFLLNGIPTHFDDGDGHVAIENTIHLFSDQVRAGVDAGFQLRELEERVIDDEWVERAPKMRNHLGKPVSYALVWELT